MTITPQVKRQFFAHDGERSHVIRLPPAAVASPVGPNRRIGKPWSKDEHERFLEGLQMYPNGPWRRIASHVGTRTSRQTMTHAQKYRERISRMLVPSHQMQIPSSPRHPETSTAATSAQFLPPSAPLPGNEHPTVVNHHHLDALDLEILSSLLDDGAAASDDSSSSYSDNQDEGLVGLMSDDGDDSGSMLNHPSNLAIDDHAIPLGL